MKILSVNSGSSSVKIQLFTMPEKKLIAKWSFEKVGFDKSFGSASYNNTNYDIALDDFATHKSYIEKTLQFCIEHNIIDSIDDIDGVGHRVVMGADKFSSSVLINEDVEQAIQDLYDLAPLHNPANYEGIKAFKEINPSIKQVACFDTAFHQSMPLKNKTFPINYKVASENKIQRYGAHGTSVNFVINEYAKNLNKNVEDLNVIVAHIGSGSSITAIKNGKSFATSMGYSPLGGIMMGTRSGDLDPSVVLKLVEIFDGDYKKVSKLLNNESGLLGVSGLSNDMRDISDAKSTNEQAKLAFDLFVERIIDFIGMYAIKYEKLDAVIFCAGLGENSIDLHKEIRHWLKNINVSFAPDFETRNNMKYFSSEDSKVECLIIPTNEELMIAQDTTDIINEIA